MIVWWILVVLASAFLGWRIWQRYDRYRRAMRRRNGQPVPPRVRYVSVRGRRMHSLRYVTLVRVRDSVQKRGPMGYVIFGLIVVVLLLLVMQMLRGMFSSSETADSTTKVLVAHFVAPDGSPSPDGASVAQSLVYAWSSDPEQRLTRPVQVVLLNESINAPEEALRVLQRHKADAVIWGTVEPGGGANLASLAPRLLWLPRASLWYERHPRLRERVAMPPVYALSFQPVNGAALLGDVVEILDLMREQEPDLALQQINLLLDRYASQQILRADMLYGLRGMIALMQDQPQAAEEDFRRALELAEQPRPEYWNNLALALAFQGRTAEAVDTFNTALDLADGRLAPAFYNRGLLLLASSDPAIALPDLIQATTLQPDGVAAMTTLSEAQLQVNQINEATASINRAFEIDPSYPLLPLVAAKVEFAKLLDTGRYLDWELYLAPPLPRQPLTDIRLRLDSAVAMLEQLVVANRQQAASADASSFPERGRVFESRAQTYEDWLQQTRYWRSIALIEEGIVERRERPGGLRGFWNGLFGDDPPLAVAQTNLQAMVRENEDSYAYRILLGRALLLLNAFVASEEQYRAAIEINSVRPEAWYGLASLYADRPETPERDATVRDALNQALAANERFVPAHVLLARFEMRQENWEAALPPLIWLVDNRPDLLNMRLRLGVVLREVGRLAEAEQMLLPLANNGDTVALVELAKLYSIAGRPDVAEQVLLRVLHLNPQAADAAYQLGLLYQDQAMFVEAEQRFLQAITINENYVEAHLALGRLYSQVLDRPENAVAAYQRAINVGAATPQNYEDLGRAFLELGEYEQASNALERAVALNPNVPESQHLLAQTYIELGRYDAARERERAAIASTADGVYVDAQIGIAESFRRQGLYAEALTAFNQALDLDPTVPAAYVGLGRIAADQQDWQTAIGYYNQALNYAPGYAAAHLALGQALVEQGFYSRALVEFEQVLVSDPTNPDAYYGAGRAYNQLAALEASPTTRYQYQLAAREMLDKALTYRPSFGLALLERGMLNELEGLNEAALNDYVQAARLLPDNGTASFLLGKLYLTLNQVSEATKALQAAISRDPTNAPAHYWLGRAYRVSSNTGGALEAFDRALELNAGLTEARYYKGLTLEETNQPDVARTEYETILAQTTPDNVWHQQAQEQLRELTRSP